MVYSIDEQTEKLLVEEQFLQALQIFENELYRDEDPVFCKVYDLFCTQDSDDHNCIGCNLWESADLVRSFLQMNNTLGKINQAYTLYIMMTYLFASRIETIFKLIGFNDAHKDEQFIVLQRIRRFANFLKHPKAMVLAHHPSYVYEGISGLETVKEFDDIVVIDEIFISKYYVFRRKDSKKYDDALFDILQNTDRAIVVFPNVIELTQKLCGAVLGLIELLENNDDYLEALSEKSTFLNYWEDVNQEDVF